MKARDGATRWDTEQIRELLRTNPRAVVRGVEVIHQRQTLTEQVTASTRDRNGVGWNAFDAEYMTRAADMIARRRRLPPSMLPRVRHRLMKYAGQLARVANGDA